MFSLEPLVRAQVSPRQLWGGGKEVWMPLLQEGTFWMQCEGFISQGGLYIRQCPSCEIISAVWNLSSCTKGGALPRCGSCSCSPLLSSWDLCSSLLFFLNSSFNLKYYQKTPKLDEGWKKVKNARINQTKYKCMTYISVLSVCVMFGLWALLGEWSCFKNQNLEPCDDYGYFGVWDGTKEPVALKVKAEHGGAKIRIPCFLRSLLCKILLLFHISSPWKLPESVGTCIKCKKPGECSTRNACQVC